MPASSSNNQHLVGTALAQAVAKRLQGGEILAYQHRDYCGIGLCFTEGLFVCGEVYDGSLGVTAWGATCEHQTFATQAEFVQWLAGQSDESLSGKQLKDEFQRENQRLSIAPVTGIYCDLSLTPSVKDGLKKGLKCKTFTLQLMKIIEARSEQHTDLGKA